MGLYLNVRLACWDGMSAREAAHHSWSSRESVEKTLSFSVPPEYRRTAQIKRPGPGRPLAEAQIDEEAREQILHRNAARYAPT